MGQQGNARRFDAESYKPGVVPQALRAVQGAAEGRGGDYGALQAGHPIRNAVRNVFIGASDLRRSAEWYAMAMGLPVLEERLNGGLLYSFGLACGTGIVLDNNPDRPDDPLVRFAYPTDDIEAAYAFVRENGFPLLTDIKRPDPALAYFSIEDPDGNKLMVMQSSNRDDVLERLHDTDSPILNRIGGIFVHVADMDRAARFHSAVLGLPCPPPDNTIYELKTSGGASVLLDGNHLINGDPDRAMFMLDTPDVESAKRYMAANGVLPFRDIERFGPIAFFTVKDPDGNEVMVCQNDDEQ